MTSFVERDVTSDDASAGAAHPRALLAAPAGRAHVGLCRGGGQHTGRDLARAQRLSHLERGFRESLKLAKTKVDFS